MKTEIFIYNFKYFFFIFSLTSSGLLFLWLFHPILYWLKRALLQNSQIHPFPANYWKVYFKQISYDTY